MNADGLKELAQSRQRVREALGRKAHPVRRPLSLKNGIGGVAEELGARAQQLPGVGLVMDVAGKAWQRHPARRLGGTVILASKPLVEQAARRSPSGLLITSAGVGALLALAPWRVFLRPPKTVKQLAAATDRDRSDR